MVCVYCGKKTAVVNSRSQTKLRQTWRRHACVECGAIYTTTESVDLSSCFRVQAADDSLQPFARDKLYISIYKALAHRTDAVDAATHLTATIIAKILPTAQTALIERRMIREHVHVTLTAFDTSAANIYAAYHRSAHDELHFG